MSRQKRQVVVIHRPGKKWELLGFLLIVASIVMFVMSTEEGGKHDLSMQSVMAFLAGFVVFLFGRFK